MGERVQQFENKYQLTWQIIKLLKLWSGLRDMVHFLYSTLPKVSHFLRTDTLTRPQLVSCYWNSLRIPKIDQEKKISRPSRQSSPYRGNRCKKLILH